MRRTFKGSSVEGMFDGTEGGRHEVWKIDLGQNIQSRGSVWVVDRLW